MFHVPPLSPPVISCASPTSSPLSTLSSSLLPTLQFPTQIPWNLLCPYDDLILNEEFLRNPTSNDNNEENPPIDLFYQKVTIPHLGIFNTCLRYVKRSHRNLLFPRLRIRRFDDDTVNRKNVPPIIPSETFRIQEQPHEAIPNYPTLEFGQISLNINISYILIKDFSGPDM